jgi:hypothetical protein
VVVESAVVLADPVTDAARPVGVVKCAVVRQPAQLVKQAQNICDAVAAGLGRWEGSAHDGGLLS